MSCIVVYKTKYGSTKEYAEWIAEDLGCEAVAENKMKPAELLKYDAIVFGGCIRMGKIAIADFINKNWSKLEGKKIILFSSSGAAPTDTEELQANLERCFSPEILSKITYIPLHGRMIPDKFDFLDGFAMGLAGKMIKDPEEKKKFTATFDYVKRENIKPVVSAVKG
jgi:menaquinone-dependent protoporphyrinogen IX oxidase